MSYRRARTRIALAGLVAALAVAPAAYAKSNGGSATQTSSCLPASSPVLTAFGDANAYFLAPDGGFEAGAAGWTLAGGAAVVGGNETFFVHAAADSRSMSLPAGSSATSPFLCVNVTAPSMRFFLKNTGAASSQLALDVIYRTASSGTASVQVATFSGGSAWQLSPSTAYYSLLVGIMPPTASGTNNVSFRFRPLDAAGNWSVDDVYVDPFKRV
jgi:hypothetical protein